MSAFEMLAKMSGAAAPPTPEGLLTLLVRSGAGERGFLVWGNQIWAVDVDGFPLGHGGDRLHREQLPTTPGEVVRRETPSATVSTTLDTGAGRVTLVLEHRFRAQAFDGIVDEEFRRWALLAAVVLRWSSAATQSAIRAEALPAEEPRVVAAPGSSEQQRSSLQALAQHDWNISRAARSLGMTRHGLKKRMSRLGIARPQAKR